MNKFWIVFVFSAVALAQNVRYDAPFPSINSQTAQPFLIANVPPNSPTLAVCHSPANQVPCTNFATTFTGSNVACPNGAQDTPQPATTSACQAVGDAQGNIGFWAPSGTYDYTVCVATTCFGPFTVTLNLSSGAGGNPAAPAGSIQVNNSGVFGAISPVPAGSAVVSNFAGTGFTPQTKYLIDARDIGVDCTYTNDSSTVLNNLTNNQAGFGGNLTGATLVFPPGCHVKLLNSNWKITNQSTFTIRGAGRAAAPFAGTATTISYCANSATVPVIDMESTFGAEVSNLIVETKGTGCSTGTNVGITVDRANATSTVNSTDNFLHDLTIITNMSGGAGPSGWVGLAISPVSGSNVEDTRLWNSRINCESTTNNSSAIQLSAGGSFNAKLEEFKHDQITACAIAFQQNDGNWSIESADLGGNAIDVFQGPGSDPALITNIVSESNQLFNGVGSNWPTTLVSNHVGWNSSGSTGLCGIDLSGGGGNQVLIGDGADPVPGNAPNAQPLCGGSLANILDIGGQYSGAFTSAPPQGVIIEGLFALGKGIGNDLGAINGGMFRVTNAAPSPSNTVQYIGYGFISHTGMDMTGLTFNANSSQECVGGGRPCVGQDVIYLGNEGLLESGMWPVPQWLQFCTYTGTAGSTHWGTAILPIDANGKRAGVYPFGGNWGCNNAASTLSVSNFLTVSWPRVAGAVSYAVILLNPISNTQGELISTVADTGSGITQSFNITNGSSGDSFNYAFPLFYESATTFVQGESLNSIAPVFVSQPNTATAINNFSSTTLDMQAQVWNGSAGINDNWNWQNIVGAGTNPTSTLTLTHSGSSGAATVNVPALVASSVLVPAGTSVNPTLDFTASNTTGLFLSGGGAFAAQSAVGLSMNTNVSWFWGQSTAIRALLASAGGSASICWDSTGQPTSTAVDACVDSPSAGIVGIGTVSGGTDITGRLAVAKIGSDVSTNTDSFIKLSYSAATTATYTFTGTYTNAPICVITPVNPGAVTFTLTTMSTTTVTVTASGSFTGTVDVMCGLQN